MQEAGVLRAVGQAAHIDRTSLARVIDAQLHVAVALDKHLRALQRIHALLALAEVDGLAGILQQEVVGMLLLVELAIAQREAGFLFHAQHRSQLEVVALILVTAGLAHADEAAAAKHEAADGGSHLRIFPPAAAGMGGVAVAHADKHVQAVEQAGLLLDVLEADEGHVERRAAEYLDHAGVAVVLLLVERVVHHVATPGASLAPAVEHGHALEAHGPAALDILVELAELVAHALHIIKELRELAGQLEVAAVADAVDGLAQDGAAGGEPVVARLAHGIAALVEGVGEEVWQEAALGVFDAGDVADEAKRAAVSDAAHHRVQADAGELRHVGLGADPVVAQEHHGLAAVLVGDVHKLPGQRRDLAPLEGLEVQVFLAGHAVLVVVIPLIDDVLRPEGIARFLFKPLQDVGRNRGGIAVPVHVLLPLELVKDQRELVEERGIAHDVHIRVALQEGAQALQAECMRLGLAHVEGDLVLKVLPIVDDGVVHVHRVPDEVAQEADRVLMIGLGVMDGHHAVGIGPLGRVHDSALGAVHDLPPAVDVVAGVDLHQLRRYALHQRDDQLRPRRGMEPRHDVALLHLVRVLAGPVVVLAGGVVGGIYLGAGGAQRVWEVGSVAVAQRVSAPAFHQAQGILHHVHVCGDGYPARHAVVLIHSGHLNDFFCCNPR